MEQSSPFQVSSFWSPWQPTTRTAKKWPPILLWGSFTKETTRFWFQGEFSTRAPSWPERDGMWRRFQWTTPRTTQTTRTISWSFRDQVDGISVSDSYLEISSGRKTTFGDIRFQTMQRRLGWDILGCKIKIKITWEVRSLDFGSSFRWTGRLGRGNWGWGRHSTFVLLFSSDGSGTGKGYEVTIEWESSVQLTQKFKFSLCLNLDEFNCPLVVVVVVEFYSL